MGRTGHRLLVRHRPGAGARAARARPPLLRHGAAGRVAARARRGGIGDAAARRDRCRVDRRRRARGTGQGGPHRHGGQQRRVQCLRPAGGGVPRRGAPPLRDQPVRRPRRRPGGASPHGRAALRAHRQRRQHGRRGSDPVRRRRTAPARRRCTRCPRCCAWRWSRSGSRSSSCSPARCAPAWRRRAPSTASATRAPALSTGPSRATSTGGRPLRRRTRWQTEEFARRLAAAITAARAPRVVRLGNRVGALRVLERLPGAVRDRLFARQFGLDKLRRSSRATAGRIGDQEE